MNHRYQYKVRPIDFSIEGGQSSDLVADKMQRIIDLYAEKGWEFVRLESVPVFVKSGFLAKLFGNPGVEINEPQLIFRIQLK